MNLPHVVAFVCLTGLFGAATAQATPRITDLTVERIGRYSVALGFTDTNTQNDAAIEIRYSTTEITAANYSSCAIGYSDMALPDGGPDCRIISNQLTQCLHYYFAMKIKDSPGTWSDLSNVAEGSTACPPASPGVYCDQN